ncbi:MAG: BamA/TamA family outer membrane protein [Acidobacteria bacterium]|nr:BamA/TamA family outer membrane protein [Acidobacteriota bacterium]
MIVPHRLTAPARRAVLRITPVAVATVIVTLAFGAAFAQESTAPGSPTAEPFLGGALIAAETVAEIRIHGNLSLPDAEVVALTGVTLGDAAGPDLEKTVRQRLEASGRFETVDVRRRYRSLTATDQVALVIVVRERPGARFSNPVMRALAAAGRRLMVAPILDHREGYGVAYGALTSFIDTFGPGSRLSVPATWGGHKRIALEMETPIRGSVIDRLWAVGSRGRRRHPYFDMDVDRARFAVAAQRGLPRGFRMNGEAAWEEARFAGRADRFVRTVAYLDYGDYRETPANARRNTVVVRAGIERLAIEGGAGAITRPRLDARAYRAVGRQAVLAARFFFAGASAPLPPYERALLGGSPAAGGTLRGWRAGAAVGDRIAAASMELRLPITSVLSEGRVGLRFFYDTAAVYDAGRPIRNARFREGAGAGVFFLPPGFGFPMSIDVAGDPEGGARVHVSAGFGF